LNVAVFAAFPAEHKGGGYTFETEILQSLEALQGEAAGHRFCVVSFDDGGQQARVERRKIPRSAFIERAAAAVSRRLTGRVIVPRSMAAPERALRDMGADFVWFASAGAHFGVDLPYVTVVWDVEHRNYPYFPELSARGQWQIREAAYSTFLPRATYVITGTQVGRREVERFYGVPGERVRVLAHPTPRFALEAGPKVGAGAAQRHGLKPGYLVYPAQFWAHKNHVNLLLALKHLREREGLRPELALLGSDKGNQAHVERVIREAGLDGQVKMLGFVPQEDLVGLYREALALTYVSFCGPENMPPLEAFALGCPVVASRIGGAQEQLGDAALLVDPRDPADIARGIKAVHDDARLREELRTRGFARARRWTGREFVRGVFKLLDEFEPVRRAF
jgi:glycosyltransferase involved in cell wall biosynthesis